MGLRYVINAFDKKTNSGVYEEYSKDFGEDHSLMDAINIPIHDNINNGVFDIQDWWIPILQPHFKHVFNMAKYNYDIDFQYRDKW